nr:hypothetical protein [Tanacetum cinerariifolium]
MKDSPQPTKRRRYDAAFRTEALRLAEQSRSTQVAARALNISPKLLYKWQKEALTPVAAARGAELDPATAAELRQLRALARRQAQELDILKKAIATPLWHPPAAGRPTPQVLPRRAAAPARGYASPKPVRALNQGFTPRTTDSTHGLRCAPNRLLNQPKPTQANQVWVSNIIYLPLANGDWAYLCAYQDMVSKQVVGWHVMVTMPEELITTALQRAFWAQPPTPGLLVHSDRGEQYCGNVYRKLLHDHQSGRSQSRRGDCYDNAQAESLCVIGLPHDEETGQYSGIRPASTSVARSPGLKPAGAGRRGGHYQEDDLPHGDGPDGAHAGRARVSGRGIGDFAGGTSDVCSC